MNDAILEGYFSGYMEKKADDGDEKDKKEFEDWKRRKEGEKAKREALKHTSKSWLGRAGIWLKEHGLAGPGYDPAKLEKLILNHKMEKKAENLTTNARAHIKTKNFGIPSKAENAGEKHESGNYPIEDIKHARAALSYGSRYLSPEKYAALKSRIHGKYPELAKEAKDSHMGLLGEYAVSPTLDSIITGGVGNVGGLGTAIFTPTVSHKEVGKYNDSPIGLIPGVGPYRLAKRLGSTTKDAKGKEVPGARASAVWEGISNYNPVNLLGLPVAAIVALATARRTAKEQAEHDKHSTANAFKDMLIPGVGVYDQLKRYGSTTAY